MATDEIRGMKRLFYALILLLVLQEAVHSQSAMSLAINEILFNPSKDGYDYVELYNYGTDTIDLQTVMIANRNVTHDLASLRALTKTSRMLAPDAYVVLTANEKWLRLNYRVPPEAQVLVIAQLPSFPDDEGEVIICSAADSSVIDEVDYLEKWHSPMLADVSGVALERINYGAKGNDKNNWMSASSASGYGTPGAQNSQFRADLLAEGEVVVSPKIVSPDNDGWNDFAVVRVQVKEPGYVANTFVYDVSGRRVRYLLKNVLLGTNSQFVWDGCDDNAQRLAKGAYIICTEVFNLQGKTKKFKAVVVLNYKN
jgi:hypothetical protein